MLNVPQIAGDKVIHCDHVVTFLYKPVAKMRAQETGTSRNEHFLVWHVG